MEKYQYFNGLKFTRDDKTGYYLNSTIRKRMHRYVWEYYNGTIPKGCCIHHIDHNRGNNDISNLHLMSKSEHSTMHGNERAEKCYDEMCRNLKENAVPKSKEWHCSKAGHDWHKKHYEETKNKLHAEHECICEYCGKKFKSKQTRSRFCSNACKSAYRRKSGVDNEKRVCPVCGKTFEVSKYSSIRTCSRECGRMLRKVTSNNEKV